MSASEKLSSARKPWPNGMPSVLPTGFSASTHPLPLTALLPLPCLFLVTLLARAGSAPSYPPVVASRPIRVEAIKSAPSLAGEVKATMLRYRTLKGEEQKQATQARTWKSWETTWEGDAVAPRLDRLRVWPDFSVQNIQRRPSGFVTAILSYDDEQLKVWLVPGAKGWEFAGLVPVLHEFK